MKVIARVRGLVSDEAETDVVYYTGDDLARAMSAALTAMADSTEHDEYVDTLSVRVEF